MSRTGKQPKRRKSRIPPAPKIPYCSPMEFVTNLLHLQPDPTQLQLLETNPRRLILNCSRQWGKSTITSAQAVYHAVFQPGSLILVLSPTGRQSSEFVSKAATWLRLLHLPVRGDGHNDYSLRLPNNSRIVGLPGKDDNIRGFSAVSMLLIDEASRVPDALYRAVRPMLATSDGQLWLMSTPNGRDGFFYREWASDDAQWTRISVPATACPRISPEFLAEERRALPLHFFEQEYLCQFHHAEDAVFSAEVIANAFNDAPPLILDATVNPLVRYANLPEPFYATVLRDPRARYFIGIDLGKNQDHTAIAILERTTRISGPRDPVTWEFPTETVYTIRYLERLPLGTSYADIINRIRMITRHPSLNGNRELIVDNTGVGQPVTDMLRRSGIDCLLTPITITAAYRRDLLSKLELALEQGRLKISRHVDAAAPFREELQNLRRLSSSHHDDLVFAAALSLWRAM